MTPVERRTMRAVQAVLTPDLLNPTWVAWAKEHAPALLRSPVGGHCYAASEAMYHLLGGSAKGYTSVTARDDLGGVHRWLRGPDGSILDPTAAQYLPGKPPYARGRGRGFQTVKPSRRAAEIMRRVSRAPSGPASVPGRAAGRKANPTVVPLDTIDMDGIVEALSEAAVQKAKVKTPESLHGTHIGSLNDETLDIKGRRQPFVVQAWFYNAPSSEQHVIGGSAGFYEGGIVVDLQVNAKDGPRIRTAYRLGYLQADMKRVPMHELTHVRLHRTIAKQRRYTPLPLGVPMSYSQALTYYNDPVEVPAFTQQIVAEAKAEAKRLRGKVGERLLIDRAVEASWTWQEMSKYLFTENRQRILKAVVRGLEDDGRLPNPAVIPIDKNRVLALAQALEDWLAKNLTGKGPLGERILVPGVPYDITSASGEPIDVYVRLRSVATRSPYYAVSGGTGSDKHGQKFVVVDLNGSIPQERIQLPAKMKAGVASQLYPILLHELTHAADTYAKGLGAKGQQGGAEYYNDPSEVRAYMQEVVDEVQQHRPDSRARLAEAFGAGKGMQYLVRLSTTWREIEPHLTEKNKRKIILAVVKATETR